MDIVLTELIKKMKASEDSDRSIIIFMDGWFVTGDVVITANRPLDNYHSESAAENSEDDTVKALSKEYSTNEMLETIHGWVDLENVSIETYDGKVSKRPKLRVNIGRAKAWDRTSATTKEPVILFGA